MTKVFAYLRVSGKGQLEGDGFDRQRAAIQAFCDSKGWSVLRWFEERGVSGTNEMGDRPALTELVSLLGPATTDTMIVENADRLARDLRVSELILEDFRQIKAHVFDASSQMDLTVCDDPTRVMIRQMLGAVAEWNKSMLVKKLKAARDRKSKQLGRRIEGPVPYERKSSGGEETARVIVMMHEEQGKTFEQIARALTREGLPTPAGKHFWFKSSVEAIYARCAYSFSTRRPEVADQVRHVLPQLAV